MVRAEEPFSQNEKKPYRNIQYSYLLSKSIRNFVPGLLKRPKCQLVFPGTKRS